MWKINQNMNDFINNPILIKKSRAQQFEYNWRVQMYNWEEERVVSHNKEKKRVYFFTEGTNLYYDKVRYLRRHVLTQSYSRMELVSQADRGYCGLLGSGAHIRAWICSKLGGGPWVDRGVGPPRGGGGKPSRPTGATEVVAPEAWWVVPSWKI